MLLGKSRGQLLIAQYCIGTWTVRSMNQGKLEVVKQEMARVNVDILGISKLKWPGMMTPRGSLECNPEIPAFPGEEY